MTKYDSLKSLVEENAMITDENKGLLPNGYAEWQKGIEQLIEVYACFTRYLRYVEFRLLTNTATTKYTAHCIQSVIISGRMFVKSPPMQSSFTNARVAGAVGMR